MTGRSRHLQPIHGLCPGLTVRLPASPVRGVILITWGEVTVDTFAWVAGVIVGLIAVIALTDFLGAGWRKRAVLRKPPQDPHKHARIQAEGSRRKDDIGGGLGGGG